LDISGEIDMAVPCEAVTEAIISLACDLLPFFKPSKEIATLQIGSPELYWKILQTEPVFKALCYFVQSAWFDAEPSLEEGMLQMADDFISAKNGIFQVRDNNDITALLRALRSCHPLGLSRFGAASAVEKLEPAILVAYASEMDPKFKV